MDAVAKPRTALLGAEHLTNAGVSTSREPPGLDDLEETSGLELGISKLPLFSKGLGLSTDWLFFW